MTTADPELAARRRQLQAELEDSGRLPHDHARLREELRQLELLISWHSREAEFTVELGRAAARWWAAHDGAEEALRGLIDAGHALNASVAERNNARRLSGLPLGPTDHRYQLDVGAQLLGLVGEVVATLPGSPYGAIRQHCTMISRDGQGVPARPEGKSIS